MKLIFFISLLNLIMILSAWGSTGSDLLSEHQFLKEMSTPEIMGKFGAQLADKTQRFLYSKEGKDYSKSKEGKELLRKQKWLVNYLFLKKKFKNCGALNGKRQLGERIVDSFQHFEMSEDCDYLDVTQPISTSGVLSSLNKDMTAIQREVFHTDLWMTSMKNSLTARAGHLLTHGLVNNDPLTISDLPDALVREACIDGKIDVCSQVDKTNLKKEIDNFIKSNASRLKPKSRVEVADEINSEFHNLNQKLRAISIETRPGFKFPVVYDGDTPEMEDQYLQSKFSDYQQSYLKFAFSGSGPLLMTDALRKKQSTMRSLNEADMNKEKKGSAEDSRFTFKLHQKVTAGDVEASVLEVDEKISKHMRSLKRSMRADLDTDSRELKLTKQIRQMVLYSPVAVAESLMHHPENVDFVCQALNRINKDDKSDEEFKQYAMWGGSALGVGLLVTGVGAGAGAAVLGSAFAGSATAIATAATLSSVASGALVAGTVLGIGQGALAAGESYSKYNESNEIALSLMTHNTDSRAMYEFNENYLAFKEARFEAALNLGLGAADMGAVGIIFGASKTAIRSAEEVEQISLSLKKLRTLYKSVGEKVSTNKFVEALKLMGKNADEKLDLFLVRLSQSKDSVRIRFLEKLKTSEITPEKLKKMIEESLEASKRCKN